MYLSWVRSDEKLLKRAVIDTLSSKQKSVSSNGQMTSEEDQRWQKKGSQDVLLLQADETEGNSVALTPLFSQSTSEASAPAQGIPGWWARTGSSEEFRECLINLRVLSTEPIWKSASLLHMKTSIRIYLPLEFCFIPSLEIN